LISLLNFWRLLVQLHDPFWIMFAQRRRQLDELLICTGVKLHLILFDYSLTTFFPCSIAPLTHCSIDHCSIPQLFQSFFAPKIQLFPLTKALFFNYSIAPLLPYSLALSLHQPMQILPWFIAASLHCSIGSSLP
jgi:hypothetical protein